jgi:hypothetical protein
MTLNLNPFPQHPRTQPEPGGGRAPAPTPGLRPRTPTPGGGGRVPIVPPAAPAATADIVVNVGGGFTQSGSSPSTTVDPRPTPTQRLIEVTQNTIAAANSVLPVMYGGPLRQGAMVAGLVTYKSTLYMIAVVCHGEIGAFGTTYFDDKAVTGSVYIENHRGTPTQAVSAKLVEAYAANGITFADAMPGVAYQVIGIPADYGLQNFPRIVVEVTAAMKVYDIRTGQIVGSSNPVNALANFIQNPVYGAGRELDQSSFAAAANFCDENIGTDPMIPRKRMSLSMTESQDIDKCIADLAKYTGCFCFQREGKYFLRPFKRSASAAFFGMSSIMKDSLSLSRVSMRQSPTAASVDFTNIQVTPFHTQRVPVQMQEVTDGTLPYRNQGVAMPGVTSYSQAQHDAVEMLNRSIIGRLRAAWRTFDNAAAREPGEVVTLNVPPFGVNNQLMLLNDVIDLGFGRWELRAESYSDAIFSATVVPEPPPIDPGDLIPPSIVEFVGPVTGAEELSQKKDGTWIARLRFNWPNVAAIESLAYYATALYDVTISSPGVQVAAGNVPVNEYVSNGTLIEGRKYRLGVVAVSYVGASSPIVYSNAYTIAGKTALPGDVPQFELVVMQQSVFASWEAAIDIDIAGYEIRIGTIGTPWDLMAVVNRLDSLSTMMIAQPVGTWEYAIKAYDTVGGYSVNEVRRVAIIEEIPGGILAAHRFMSYTPSNMGVFSRAGGRAWASIDPAGTWGDEAANPDDSVGTFDDPRIICVPCHVPSSMVVETHDFGEVISGLWTFDATIVTLDESGARKYLSMMPFAALGLTREISADGVTWIEVGNGVKAEARYARARVDCPSGTVMETYDDWMVTCTADIREENGSVVVDNTGIATVLLNYKYVKVESILVSCESAAGEQNVALWRNPIVGLSVQNSFEVEVFNMKNGQANNGTVSYWFKGL